MTPSHRRRNADQSRSASASPSARPADDAPTLTSLDAAPTLTGLDAAPLLPSLSVPAGPVGDVSLASLGTEPAEPEPTKPQPAPPLIPSHRLPAGAWLRLTISGGLLFRRRDLVLYRDGRVALDGAPSESPVLSPARLATLRQLVDAADLEQLPSPGRQPADGNAYEIAVRQCHRVLRAEAVAGRIPPSLAPLLAALRALLAGE